MLHSSPMSNTPFPLVVAKKAQQTSRSSSPSSSRVFFTKVRSPSGSSTSASLLFPGYGPTLLVWHGTRKEKKLLPVHNCHHSHFIYRSTMIPTVPLQILILFPNFNGGDLRARRPRARHLRHWPGLQEDRRVRGHYFSS